MTRDAHRGPRRSWRVVLVSTLALGGCGRSADHRAQAVAAFETVRRVLQHPRCLNCHVAGDAPRQLDLGSVHAQSVVRGPDGTGARGLPCSTCHRDANPPDSYGTQAPPGAPSWRLPPPGQRMVFEGLSAVELCERLKDPRTNGGKDLAALVDHVRHDPLVRWGWAPGNGRAPVPVPHAELVAAFERWVDAEAPCPAWGR